MSAKQILVVEDERPIREMIAFGLRRAGFEVREAADARSGRAEVANKRPDLLLVDWMLPDTSGLEFTRGLKRDRETRELPVILLTARAEEGDKIAGLEGGADDYITKPFSPRELLARINAVLRRVMPVEGTERVEIEGLVLDQSSQRVSAANHLSLYANFSEAGAWPLGTYRLMTRNRPMSAASTRRGASSKSGMSRTRFVIGRRESSATPL